MLMTINFCVAEDLVKDFLKEFVESVTNRKGRPGLQTNWIEATIEAKDRKVANVFFRLRTK